MVTPPAQGLPSNIPVEGVNSTLRASYICIYIYMCIYIYVYIYIYTYLFIYIYIYMLPPPLGSTFLLLSYWKVGPGGG